MGRRHKVLLAIVMIAGSSCSSAGVSTPGPTSPASTGVAPRVLPLGEVVATAPMMVPRAAHSATALASGDVLVTGGFGEVEEVFASAELYSATTRSFSPTGTMSVARQSHSATLLDRGEVLIAGGYGENGDRLASAEIYSPATGSFRSTGAMLAPRADHTATRLSDGRVLIVGGTGPGYSFLDTAEIFDPETGTFSPTGSMTVARESATATLLQDGGVLVTGGDRGRHEQIVVYASAELYDPAKGRFTSTGSMTIARHKHDAAILPNGEVLIVGGVDERTSEEPFASAELYDPMTGRFTPAGSMSAARYKMRGTTFVMGKGRVVVASGAPTPEIFDPHRGVFHLIDGSMGRYPLFAAAAPIDDGELLLTGGYSTTGPPSADAWLISA
jgi:hypothetical protein